MNKRIHGEALYRNFKLALDLAISHILCYVAHPPLERGEKLRFTEMAVLHPKNFKRPDLI